MADEVKPEDVPKPEEGAEKVDPAKEGEAGAAEDAN
jgi:hypothetical protein